MFRKLSFFLIFTLILFADYDNVTLSDLIKKTALLNNINIVYSDFNSSKRYTLTINNFIKAKDLLEVLKSLLQREGYKLDKLNKSFYIVSKIKDKRYNYIYKVKNSNSDLILNRIINLYPGEVFKLDNNYILIKYSSQARRDEIIRNIKIIDITSPTYFVSINIYNVDTNALHQIGINLNNTNNITNGIIIERHMRFIPILLNLLNDNKKSKLIASPKLFLSPDTNNTAIFKEVTTIPITIKKTQIIQGTNPVINNIDETIYKDIGLTLKLAFINATKDNKVKFKLELTDSNIINITETGITSSNREIKAIVEAELDKPLFVAGLSKTITTKRTTGVPILEDIPLIKYLFTTKKIEKENRTLLITLTIRKAQNGTDLGDNLSYIRK